MRLIIILLTFIHAFIHLFGFFKAFGIAEMKELSLPVSRPMGVLWLVAFLMLLFTAVAYWLRFSHWWIVGIAAVALSQFLVIFFWSDARWGTLPNVIILLAAVMAFSGHAFSQTIRSEREAMAGRVKPFRNQEITQEELDNLPGPVKKWLAAAGVEAGTEKINTVRLKQKARLKLKPEQNDWYDAEAEQFFTVNPPAFSWTVNLKMFPLARIKGRDKFTGGAGEMQIKMNSLINIVKATGDKIDEGSLQRFLGEIVWFPTAAIHPGIRWEPVDSLTARATLTVGGTKGSGTFFFSETGDLKKFTALRYKGNEAGAERHQWIITVKETKEINGLRIPVKLESTWILEEGPWTWLDMEITRIVYHPALPG